MATVILMIGLERKGTIFGQVLVQSQIERLAENITAGMIRIDAMGKGIILAPFHAAAYQPGRIPLPATVREGVAMHAPGTGISRKRRFVVICFFRNDIDDTADGTAAIADRSAAFRHFDMVDRCCAGQTG